VPPDVVVYKKNDGVSHELPRAVVSGVTAALNLEDRNILRSEVSRSGFLA
jgi:hypothetical protein